MKLKCWWTRRCQALSVASLPGFLFSLKKTLVFWSLGLFLALQGSHSNRLHVWLGSMATKGCDFIKREQSLPRKMKIRTWKMSGEMACVSRTILEEVSPCSISLRCRCESHRVATKVAEMRALSVKLICIFAFFVRFIHSSYFWISWYIKKRKIKTVPWRASPERVLALKVDKGICGALFGTVLQL